MAEFNNPFTEGVNSPGQKYQAEASVIAEALQLFIGLHLSPKGVDALSSLLGEVEIWYKTQKAIDFRKLMPVLISLLTRFGQTKE